MHREWLGEIYSKDYEALDVFFAETIERGRAGA